jgi:hypothetical protein
VAQVLVKLPVDENDNNYRREWFRRRKFLNGVGSYSFLMQVMKDVKSHLDFEPKLPLKKVVKFINFDFHRLRVQLQGVYHVSNFSIFDGFVQFKFWVEIRTVAKFRGQKNRVNMTMWTFFGEAKGGSIELLILELRKRGIKMRLMAKLLILQVLE